MRNGNPTTGRMRVTALAIAIVGLVLTAYVEFWLTAMAAPDPLGWFCYESVAWLALLGIGPFLPVSATVLAGGVLALSLEAAFFWLVFVVPDGTAHAGLYLWKLLAQLALIAASWLAGYLVYLRTLRTRAHG